MPNISVNSIELLCGHTLYDVVMSEDKFHDLQEGITPYWCPNCGATEISEISENYEYTTEKAEGEN